MTFNMIDRLLVWSVLILPQRSLRQAVEKYSFLFLKKGIILSSRNVNSHIVKEDRIYEFIANS